ncbi:MAG: response regulator transcription factor [Acidobacteriota bacterium]
MHRIRILLADDHSVMLEKVAELLQPEFDVIGSVGDGQCLLDKVSELHPDVVVVDISMPVINGIEAARLLRDLHSEVKVVFLTVHADPEMVSEAFEAGGLAYVVKLSLASDLVPAIREVLAGRSFVSTFGHCGGETA